LGHQLIFNNLSTRLGHQLIFADGSRGFSARHSRWDPVEEVSPCGKIAAAAVAPAAAAAAVASVEASVEAEAFADGTPKGL
jgi:hypothetical protein